MPNSSYLDYNATAPVRPAVADAMRALLEQPGNPSSVHRFGREARRALEGARAAVAAMVGVAPGQVIFTSGGTEANNQALRGTRGPTAVSAIEHVSVLAAVPEAARIAVDAEGRIELPALERELARRAPEMVSVMLANNETGVIQPVRDVVEVARRHGARVHCDAVQAGGKLAIDMSALGVDLLTLSAHKLGGPQGVGALVVRDGLEPEALLRGGAQERRWRPGTENLPGIVGFGRACELAMADSDWRERTGALARSARGTDRRACAGCPRVRAGRGAAAQHVVPDHARGQQPDPADRVRPRRHRRQHRLGLLVGQGRPVPRPGRHGHRAGGSGERDPGQPGLGQHRWRTSIASSMPGVGCTSARGGRPPTPGRREAARLLLPPGSRHK